MGARGPLRLVPTLAAVPNAVAGTAAADVPAVAPGKPDAVAADAVLSDLWDEIVPDLDQAGLVSPADAAAIEMCLRHFRAARAASDELAGGTSTVWDQKNMRPMKNPSEVVFRSESLAFLEYAKQLGMTFVARARTPGGATGGAEDANPFAPTGS